MQVTEDSNILQTKVSPPRSTVYLVERPRLLDKMTNALEQPLTIVAAPTGYGKTTLVSSWLGNLDGRSAWISLDQHDNDVVTVAAYLLAALHEVTDEIPLRTLSLLQSPQDLPVHVLADSLLADIERFPGPLIIALDDYHTIHLAEIHELMERIIRNLPAHAHIVFLSRQMPPLNLSRLRAQGQINEIGMADLAFTVDEAESFLAHVTGRALDHQVVEFLDQRTEGWAVGLQLAGLSVRAKSSHDLVDQLAQLGSGLIVDYLLEEVTSVIPADLQDFLMRTSILDELNAELCAAILNYEDNGHETGKTRAKQMLERVVRANLFVVSLDDSRQWYRYHHLMRDVLQRLLSEQISSTEVRELHRRASAWFAERGQILLAMQHAIAAGDDVVAAQLAERDIDQVFRDDDWRLVALRLRLVPHSVSERPMLLIARALLERIQFRMKNVLSLTDRAEAALEAMSDEISPEERRYLLGNIASLRGSAAYWAGDPQSALRLARKALDYFAGERTFSALVSAQQTAFSLAALGESEAAILFLQGLLESTPQEDRDSIARLLMGMCSVYLGEAQLLALEPVLKTFFSMAQSSEQMLTIGWANFGLGYLAYERNDLDRAESHFRTIIENRFVSNAKNVADGYVGLCLTLRAARRDDEVAETLEEFRAFVTEGNYVPYLSIVASLEMRLAALRDGVSSYAETATSQGVMNLAFQESPSLTAAQLLLISGSPEDLALAQKLLHDETLRAARLHDSRRLIIIHALSAMYWHAVGDMAAATGELRASLNIAHRGRLIRTYVDLGPTLIPSFNALRAEGVFADYIGEILQAIHSEHTQLRLNLTNREMDVLERMAQRKSNKEIAADLFLSPQTVKTHAQNLYRKLGASNRREAVQIGQRSGLIV